MKTPLARRVTNRDAFTLIELLVVIAIIAILASVTMSVGTMVINMAKRTKAQNTATQIQTAALSYYTEYSVYPTLSGAAAGDYMLDDTDSATKWGKLIECLSGMISPSSGTNVSTTETDFSNSRQIAFLSFKSNDVGNGTTGNLDAPLNSLVPSATPTSKYFNIAIDGDYDGVLGGTTGTGAMVNKLPNFTTVTTGSNPPTTGSSTAGVAVWANCNPSASVKSSNWWVHTY